MSGSLSDMQHADPATAQDGELDDLRLFSPRELYFLWERSHWAAGELDFERDRSEWAELPGDQRALLLRSIAPFFVGEERIAHAFAPILLAAEDEQETAFLATQQVDEARHMQFFDGFWRAVASHDASSSRALDDARARCNDAFTELFDRRLMQAVDRLRLDPRDSDSKVQAVGIYHLLVEGTLALTGMHFLLDYVERHAILPGFTAGMRNVKHDEHRHVAWGTWFLRRRCRAEERAGRIVAETLMELLPIAASVLLEEGSAACDGLDDCAFLDYPSAELNHLALLSLARRLKVIGGATAEVQQFAASGAWRAARVL